MKPLAKLWTWTGQVFVPLAIGWAIYIRNGVGEKAPADGVLISRAYWGLLITLLAAATLASTCALYMRLASKRRARLLVPPNTLFEEGKERNAVISYGTACIFTLTTLAALIMFGVGYSNSLIHEWNARAPIAQSFWGSRLIAHGMGCSSPPCFAVGPRVDGVGAPIFGVNEYNLYLTDGALVLAAVLLGSSLVYLGLALRSPR
jgi:hypothetical protein